MFGGAPNAVLQPQKIFDAVRSCAWISRPMTGFEHGGSRLELAVGLGTRVAVTRRRPGGLDLGGHLGLERLEVLGEHAAPACAACAS